MRSRSFSRRWERALQSAARSLEKCRSDEDVEYWGPQLWADVQNWSFAPEQIPVLPGEPRATRDELAGFYRQGLRAKLAQCREHRNRGNFEADAIIARLTRELIELEQLTLADRRQP